METQNLVYAKRDKKAGKPPKSQERLNAEKGIFKFKEIHGLQLKEVDWVVPDAKVRKSKRRQFNGVRESFLKHIGETMAPELKKMGMTDKQIDQVKKGNAPVGYNVHHKLPIFGGGKNEFSNLIIMPIPPHDDLHHKVMDPQVQGLQSGMSKKVIIPWTDDMVFNPEKDKDNTKQNPMLLKQLKDKTR